MIELKALKSPPILVKKVMGAISVLMGMSSDNWQ